MNCFKTNPTKFVPKAGLSEFYQRQGRLDDAIEAINKAIPYLIAYKGEGSQQHEYALGLLKAYEEERARQK